jgi:hypothetical protein
MPWDQLFDISSVMTRLRPVTMLRRPRTATDFAEALPEFMALPRYSVARGHDRLWRDILEAIDGLPYDARLAVQDRDWARLILGLDKSDETVGSRREDLKENNGSARKYRDRYVVQAVLHRLHLVALDAPPGMSSYDCGFEVRSIEAHLLARTRYPLNVRHEVKLQLRAARGGQRLVPLCYGSATPFAATTASAPNQKPPRIAYLGSTDVVTGDPAFPTHFFWLSDAPAPGARVVLVIKFDELHERPWVELHTRLRLITGDIPKLQFTAQPRRSFHWVRGYRLARDGSDAAQEFHGAIRKKQQGAALPAYQPEAKSGDEAFRLTYRASDICITQQRKAMKRGPHVKDA